MVFKREDKFRGSEINDVNKHDYNFGRYSNHNEDPKHVNLYFGKDCCGSAQYPLK